MSDFVIIAFNCDNTAAVQSYLCFSQW